jgi:hypothetical protein
MGDGVEASAMGVAGPSLRSTGASQNPSTPMTSTTIAAANTKP